MDAFVGQPAPERVVRSLVGGAQDKVDNFHWRVDDAELICLLSETDLEEALVEFGDDLLLALGGGHL